MSPLTIFLGKFLGLSYLITCVVCMARPKATLDAANSMAEDSGLLLMSGIFTMAAGVAVVIGHNVWSGGALPIAVTVLGWLMLIKGVVLMAMPPRLLIASYRFLNSPARFRLLMIPATIFGAWVAVVAFIG
ncbi:hypothetical protein K9U39_01420 [Rhodoblastus acidophilus]|uniref:Uncharacterized protein n=1 Tax=Candidatus Rhodoblastus alkanivorans TaxID=2954117 RepID=A0ABS9Z3V1_9HYPH|nr:hypothetical protein [Candidatus Rhodoblastus alkanivorans]MCI4680888.1 hypothetical protein [Candidatus Rhodoblastus alkanivorans]MCI4682309.1 hypothetical protein [Candidatus Rhodoblastus alkanivorans]MDI4639611.1 hypothetical protein [Rhodoblastus acidophilus]